MNKDYVAEAEAFARDYVTEAYTVNPDGTRGHLDAVMILDESGEHHMSFRSPLVAIKVAQRIIEIAGRVSDAKVAIYDEVHALNTALYGHDSFAPLINLADYKGRAL